MSQDPTVPATISPDGVAPDSRFDGYSGLYSSYQQAVRVSSIQDNRFTAMRGIYDRKPPQNPVELERQGLEGMPNFNTGEFTAKVDSYVSTLVDHDTGGYNFAKVRLKPKADNPPEVTQAYDEKATQFFNEAITEWEDDVTTRSAAMYVMQSTVRNTQMGIFGIGCAYFQDDTDWRFKAIPTRSVRVARGTKITLENCLVLFVDDETTVTQLYKKVKDSKEDSGWNKKAVWQLLHERTANRTLGGITETFAEWENRVRNNDTFFDTEFAPILLVSCYVQEFSIKGKKDGITHSIISRKGSPTEILFENKRQYPSYRSCLIPFTDNPGPEGDWHGVKGFGDALYDGCDFNNRFFNDMARSALIAGMPMFQVGSDADRDKVSQIRWTNLGILNPGITMEQVNVRTDITGMMGIFNVSQRTINTNSRTYPAGDTINSGGKTATQATYDRQDEAKLSTLQIKTYRMCGLDPLLAEMYRRLVAPYPEVLPGSRAAIAFKKKMEEAGVPKECYTEPVEVIADRTGGTGNMALDLMKAKELFSVSSPGRGQFNARREIAKALTGGGDRVEEFVQPEDVPQEQQTVVNLENSCLADGQGMEAEAFQEHLVHLGEVSPDGRGHFGVLLTAYQVASEIAKAGAVEQNLEDAKKLERTLSATVNHVMMHVQFLGKYGIESYQEIAKEMHTPLNDVAQFIATFRDQIGSAMQTQQQAQGPQLSGSDQAKLITAQVDIQIKKAMAEQELQYQRQNQDMKLGHKAEMSAVNNELKIAKETQALNQSHQRFEQDLGQQAVQTMTDTQIQIADAARTRAQANAEKTE